MADERRPRRLRSSAPGDRVRAAPEAHVAPILSRSELCPRALRAYQQQWRATMPVLTAASLVTAQPPAPRRRGRLDCCPRGGGAAGRGCAVGRHARERHVHDCNVLDSALPLSSLESEPECGRLCWGPPLLLSLTLLSQAACQWQRGQAGRCQRAEMCQGEPARPWSRVLTLIAEFMSSSN
jgi:hypothetical protein